MPKPVGEAGGGMANAIVGTLILIGLAVLRRDPHRRRERHLPVGVRRHDASRRAVRFAADVLNGVPSIVDRDLRVRRSSCCPFTQFAPLAGGVALGDHDDSDHHADDRGAAAARAATLREGALALGATRARAAFTVVLPAALPGIMTGILVALARIAGETAPLLFTSFNNRFWSTSLTQPIASLTVQIYTYAISPYDDWHRQAWAGALVLVTVVFLFSVLARVVTRRLERMHRT